MSIEVVSKEFEGSGTLKVVLASDSYQELAGPDVKTLAIHIAEQEGLSRAGINVDGMPYPVNADGNSTEGLHSGQEEVCGYRRDFTIRRGL